MEATANRNLISRQYFRLLPMQILLAMVGAVNGIVSSLIAVNFAEGGTMTAIGLYSPINMLITTVSYVLVSGSQIMCGKYMGRNQIDRTRHIFSLDIKLSVLFSVFMTVLIAVFAAAGGASLFTSVDADKAEMTEYMYGQLPGILPFVLGSQLFAFLSLENQNRRTTAASIAFIAVNLLSNVLLVIVLKMGTVGVSVSYSAGACAFLAVQVQYYFTGRSMMKYQKKGTVRGDVADILKAGYPGALVNLYQTIRTLIVNGLINTYVGSAGIAAFGASGSLLGIFWAIPTGYVAVSRMLMSVAVGEEDRMSLTDVMRVVIRQCIPLMCLICGALVAFAEPLTHVYYRDPSTDHYQMTMMAFRLLPLCMPFSVFLMNLTCYFQISGQQSIIHLDSFLDGVVCVSAFSALLVPLIGMNGVYIANILNGVVSSLVVIIYAAIRKKRFPRNMEDLMVIPDDFGAGGDERMDLSVRKVEEVAAVSGKVIDFCRDRKIDERRSFYAGLFLEEMAGNVVEHGFTKDRKPHTVDIRVVHKDEDVILRIKDDCIPFNPQDRLNMVSETDPVKGVGIRIIYDKASDVRYQNILGLNVLTIRI